MKRKISFLLCTIFTVCLSLLLSSCGECKHEFGSWETMKEATCVDKGTKITYCSLCNLSKTDSIDKTDHTRIAIERVEPSCSVPGLTEGVKCAVCDKILVEQEEIPITEHLPSVINGTAATCEKTGLTNGVICGICRKILLPQDIIPKAEHIFSNNICEVCHIENYSQSLTFTLNNDSTSYKVSLGVCDDDKVIIPNKYKGLPVTLIEGTAFNNGTFKEIIIPDSILTIEAGAFKGCSNLQKITIPFVGKSRDAKDKEALFGYIFSEVEFDGSYSVKQAYPSPFINANYIMEYYIPLSLSEVILTGELTFGAFDRCTSLTSVTIPDTTVKIPNYSFRDCSSLTSFYISKNINEIRGYAFIGCSSISEYIVDIDNEAFVSFDGNILSKDKTVFILYARGKSETVFKVPEGIEIIGNQAFYENSNLKEIVFPNTLKAINYESFYKSTSLEEIDFPSSLEEIEDSAFYSNSSLKSLTFPDSLKKIGYHSFDSCTQIETLIIPSSVTYIDDYAFSQCKNLQKVFLPKELIFVGEGAFWKLCKGAIIYYAGSTENTNWDDQWNASEYTIVYDAASIE
ncbi:MAG: leucine-rich repeat domain-containing protein [Clostridia bacterium]|nr:leucine-rich repeat domain-containing protein [Clostridia bacterium]